MRRLSLFFLLVLAACAGPPAAVVEETTAPPLPEASYAQAAHDGAAVYRLVPQDSLILVHTYRTGTMKRLGHDHAIASENARGFVEIGDDPAVSRADVVFALRGLLVDEAQYRDHLALDTTPSASDIAGTYTNMLKVLEPARYPWAAMQARIVSLEEQAAMLNVSITLHGNMREYRVPVELSVSDERVAVRGKTSLSQTDFGLEPFAAMGGLLRVADKVTIEFHFVADAWCPGPDSNRHVLADSSF